MALNVLLKIYLNRGFDIFKKPHPTSQSLWELLCGTGRITEPLLILLRQHLKGRLTLELLNEGKELMEKNGVTISVECSEALVKIAEQIVDETSKKEAC